MRKLNNVYLKAIGAVIVMCFVSPSWANKDMSSKTDMNSGNKVSQSDVEKHASDRGITVTFTAGSSDLSEEAKADLRNLIGAAGTNNISRIEVAAWSDKPFPRGKKDLADNDQELAEKRAEAIDDYLNDTLDISNMRIKTYNMAETSNWLARVMRTDESELKPVFSKQAVAPMERADFNMMAREGAPMKAVIVVVKKQK